MNPLKVFPEDIESQKQLVTSKVLTEMDMLADNVDSKFYAFSKRNSSNEFLAKISCFIFQFA